MLWVFLAGAVLLVVFGFVLRLWSARGAAQTGLPVKARVVYSDSGAWEKVPETLKSERYRLVGKPDYVLRTRHGLVAVEVKPTRRAPEPYESDVLQLAAYCLLLEEAWGEKPLYGLLRYAEKTFRIEWDETLREELLATLEEMRELEEYPAYKGVALPEPQHDMTARCRNCGFRYVCYPDNE